MALRMTQRRLFAWLRAAVPEKPTVLCVDDEEGALFLRKAVLQRFGFQVVSAHSAKEAIELLDRNHVDLLLSDLLMPDMSGAELAAIVKKRYPAMPVAIVSGVNDVPPDLKCADMFISKLEGPTALCERLRSLLDQVHASQGSV